MEQTPTQADSFQVAATIVRYIMDLPREKQDTEIKSIIQSGIAAVEYHDITGLTNTFQVAAIHAEASALVSVPRGTMEEMRNWGSQERAVVTTEHPYIIRDPSISHGEPIIAGTGVRVRTLVEYWRAGTPPEELLQAFPHLTLAQVFDALSYYQDHQPEMNALMAQNRVDPALIHQSSRPRS
jgi:uncharacterized protein (DUF433 family)